MLGGWFRRGGAKGGWGRGERRLRIECSGARQGMRTAQLLVPPPSPLPPSPSNSIAWASAGQPPAHASPSKGAADGKASMAALSKETMLSMLSS